MKYMDQILQHIYNVPECDTGAPCPTVFSNESNVHLFYYLNIIDENWDGTYVNIRNTNVDKGIAYIKFEHYRQYKFGSPNDEALGGHPLYKWGLRAYNFYEVKHSKWINELMEMNRIHPSHKDEYFNDCRHFIYPFHDNCFEIICESYSCEIINKNIKDALINII